MTLDLPKEWFTVEDVATLLNVKPIVAWRKLRPFRSRCRLARRGQHPRKLLWVPDDVVMELSQQHQIALNGWIDVRNATPRKGEAVLGWPIDAQRNGQETVERVTFEGFDGDHAPHFTFVSGRNAPRRVRLTHWRPQVPPPPYPRAR